MYPDNKVTPKYLTKDKKYIEKALVLVARRPFFISSRGFLKEIYKYQVSSNLDFNLEVIT